MPSLARSFAVLLVAVLLATPVRAQNRVALLVGNAAYPVGRLENPLHDLQVMESALRDVGFKVQTVRNATQVEMKRAVRDFGEMAQGADIALLYYSGHGTQAQGENYLIPVDASIRKESDYDVEAVSANAVMRQILGARPRAAIVVLDACRDNPHASLTRSGSKGLGRMDAPTGSMIAFATAPSTTASDEGFYARALAANIRKKNLELMDVFRDTAADVRRMSGNRQDPRVSEMSISERIYLAGQDDIPAPPRHARTEAATQDVAIAAPVIQHPAQVSGPAAADEPGHRSYVGVQLGDITPEIADALGLAESLGVAVQKVVADSPAAKAGMEVGDIITKVDGRRVERAADMRSLLAALKPGMQTLLTLFRRGAYETRAVTAQPLDDEELRAWGLKVSEPTDAQRREPKVPGLRVDAATDAAARAGLREGDLILMAGSAEVPTLKALQAQFAKAHKAKVITLLVARGNMSSFVLLKQAQ